MGLRTIVTCPDGEILFSNCHSDDIVQLHYHALCRSELQSRKIQLLSKGFVLDTACHDIFSSNDRVLADTGRVLCNDCLGLVFGGFWRI